MFIWLEVVCRHYHDYFLFPLYARTFKYIRLLYNQVPHLQLESPALNQAHPVSPCIKSQCAQYCLLDCTFVFPQSLKRFLSSQYPQSCRSLRFVYFRSLLPVPSPLSVFISWIRLRPPARSRLHLQPYVPVLQPCDSRYQPTPALRTFLWISLDTPVTGSRPWTVVPFSRFSINHCFLPDLGPAIGFLCSSPDKSSRNVKKNYLSLFHSQFPQNPVIEKKAKKKKITSLPQGIGHQTEKHIFPSESI